MERRTTARAFAPWVALANALLAACGASIQTLKIPLVENPVGLVEDSPFVSFDDARPHKERMAHLARDISRCERWFGDDTFRPSKLAYLDMRIAARAGRGTKVHLRLTRFDIVEYCEHAISANATAGAAAAGGTVPKFTPAPVIGDTVVLRLAGELNGVPFDVSRQFDYGTLYRFPDKPSGSLAYRALLRDRLDEIVEEVLLKGGVLRLPVPTASGTG